MKRKIFISLALLPLLAGCDMFSKKAENAEGATDGDGKYSIAVSASCAYNGEVKSDKIFGFSPGNEAQQLQQKIMNYTGLSSNFRFMAGDVDGICAVIHQKDGGEMERYIVYNQEYLMRMKNIDRGSWVEKSILAHQICHHLSGHSLMSSGSRPDMEVEADRFSGFILYKMGATLDEAQSAAQNQASLNSTSTHPSKRSRLVAITNGWLAAKEQGNEAEGNPEPEVIYENNEEPKETSSVSLRDRISEIINQYLEINGTSDCADLAYYYLPVVDNFYNKRNQGIDQIISDCIAYQSRWPYRQYYMDNSTLAISPMGNGDYFVTYDMLYKIKKDMQDDWKKFDLTINIRFTPDLKIRSIYEYQNR